MAAISLGVGTTIAVREAGAAPTAEDKALATALFKEGKALLDQGVYDQACGKLEESQRLDPGGGTLLNVALCHEKQGRIATAWSEFTEALAMARKDDRPERVQFAQEHIANLEPRLSSIVVTVAPEAVVGGLRVLRNGAVVGAPAWGSPIPVDPGTHSVEASAPGKKPWRHEVVIAGERERKSVVVPRLDDAPAPVQPLPGAVTAAPPPPSRDSGPAPSAGKSGGPRGGYLPWVLGGVGVASVGAGAWFGLRAFDKKKQSDDACGAAGCSPQSVSLNDEARTSADISTGAFVFGAAAMGVAAWWIVDDEPATAGPVRITGYAGAGHAFGSVQATF